MSDEEFQEALDKAFDECVTGGKDYPKMVMMSTGAFRRVYEEVNGPVTDEEFERILENMERYPGDEDE